jgi:hypothetical protein
MLVRLDTIAGGTGGLVETLHKTDGKHLVRLTSVPGSEWKGSVSVFNNDLEVAGMNGTGQVWGQVKNFVVDHPEMPGMTITYAAVEGPEAAMFVRGTAQLRGGLAKVDLPEHFRLLASPRDMTVVLTPHSSDSLGLAREQLEPGRLVVREAQRGKGSYGFDYLVMAKRQGYEDYKVIRPWEEFRGAGPEACRDEGAAPEVSTAPGAPASGTAPSGPAER